MGATLKRREGSGRVVAGLEPGLVVISFNVSCTKFSGFEGVRTNPSARRDKSRRQVLGDSQGRRLVYQESRASVWTRSVRSPAGFCRITSGIGHPFPADLSQKRMKVSQTAYLKTPEGRLAKLL